MLTAQVFQVTLVFLIFYIPIIRSFKQNMRFNNFGRFGLHCQPSDDESLAEIQAQIEAMMKNDIKTFDEEELKPKSSEKGSNRVIAAGSAILGAILFSYQQTQPVSGVALLNAMQRDSTDIGQAVCSTKPTVIDFYAPWCESCKVMAPTMRALEKQYSEQVNFVVVDGSDPKNFDLVDRFRVDGIPHLAFLDKDAEVKTSLIGAVPAQLVASDINALIKGETLPVEGYDPFGEGSHFPLKDVSNSCVI